ncbi:MAG TPA: molecular chaperone TorD family protein [Salinisphaeraceae bacterium]|nr:molecular chaperone TorD family protein [Salinisphaeraceae bacterium]
MQLQAAQERIELYALLAILLRQPPNAELLASLAAITLPAAAADEPELTSAWRRLQAAAQKADPAAVNDEFHDLFIGMGRGEVLPYASWYVAGFLMDRPLVALRSDLARLGITRSDDNKDPEDHAAALCETMALLADPLDGVNTQEQRQFLLMHMAPWLGRLWADITNASSADFYRAVAALGAAFFAVEQSWLNLP